MPSDSRIERLTVVGAGGLGRTVADTAELVGMWASIQFVDDRYPALNSTLHWPVVNTVKGWLESSETGEQFVVAIGENSTRLNYLRRLLRAGMVPVSIVHPKAEFSRYAKLGVGSIVLGNAVVKIGSHLGQACIVNSTAAVGHDCMIGDAVHVGPGAKIAGDVSVGERSWIGIGACVRQSIRIGDLAVVGAGAVVVKDVRNNALVKGVPAREG